MNGIGEIEIKSTSDLPDAERYDAQIRALIATKEGTMPGSRGFGLSSDISDQGPAQAVNLLTLDLSEKVEKYIPNISISDVEAKAKENGAIEATIHIERGIG